MAESPGQIDAELRLRTGNGLTVTVPKALVEQVVPSRFVFTTVTL